MNEEATTKTFGTSNLKFHLRTMQMDLEEAKSGTTVKEVEVVSPVKQGSPVPKISFDKIAQELKPKPIQSAKDILEKEVKETLPQSTRPSNELRPSLKAQPKPAYQPKTPPLHPSFTLGREVDIQKDKVKTQGLKIPKVVSGVLIILIIFGGFFAFGGVELIKGLFPTTAPMPPPTGSTPIKTQPPQQQQPVTQARNQLIPVSAVTILELARGRELNLISNIRSALIETYSLNSINQVIIQYLDNKETLTFKAFWQALGVIPPFGLIDSLEEDFNLLIYNDSDDNKRFGLIAKLKAGADVALVKNQFLSWENNFVNDWQILLSSIPTTAQGQFQNITLNQTKARFINADLSDLGIYYNIEEEKGLVFIGTSKESLERLIIAGS